MLSNRTAGFIRRRIACALQAMLLVVIGWTTAVPEARARADDPTVGLEVEYLAPSGPGDLVMLRFPIPPGYAGGVILMFEAPTEPPVPEDFDGGFLVPVEIDPATGDGVLTGVLPDTVTLDQLEEIPLELRAGLQDQITGKIWITPGIPLIPENPDDPFADESDGSNQPDDPDDSPDEFLPQSPALAGDEGETEEASGSAGSNNPGAFGGKSGKIGSFPLTILEGVPLIFGIHDQPTPIQGSGH